MKRPVSVVASLVTALGLAACGGAAGKAQIAEACSEEPSAGLNCSCFADMLEKGLEAEQFARVAEAIDANRRYGDGLIPVDLMDDEQLAAKLSEARASCRSA